MTVSSRQEEERDYHSGMRRRPRKEARHFNCSFCGITFWGPDRIDMYISHMQTRCPHTAFGSAWKRR